MLAYAANQRSPRRLSPSALVMIGAAHALAIGLLITAKMDIPLIVKKGPTELISIPLPPPPPQPQPQPKVEQKTQLPPPPTSHIDNPPPVIPTPQPGPTFDPGPSINSQVPDIGPALTATLPPPPTLLPPRAAIVRVGPRASTPVDLLRPPYPESKRRSEEEAVLRLRLSIDERGRVTAVEPVGTVDAAFLSSARSHLIRYWRYKPATEDGRAVASSLTITLRFELEE